MPDNDASSPADICDCSKAARRESTPGAAGRVRVLLPLPFAAALEPPRPRRLCALASAGCAALSGAASGTHLTAARKRVLETLRERPPLAVSELARLAECGPGVVRDLIRRGLLEERLAPSEPLISPAPDWRLSGSPLSPDQAAAARPLVDHVTAGGFRVIVPDGVTGSGKTETYFAALAAALAAGKQALVLLPEIALGAQW